MADAPQEAAEGTEEEGTESQEAAANEPKIMCYVSKRMVPRSKTVEVEYSSGKKVWVLSKYIRYDMDAEAAS